LALAVGVTGSQGDYPLSCLVYNPSLDRETGQALHVVTFSLSNQPTVWRLTAPLGFCDNQLCGMVFVLV